MYVKRRESFYKRKQGRYTRYSSDNEMKIIAESSPWDEATWNTKNKSFTKKVGHIPPCCSYISTYSVSSKYVLYTTCTVSIQNIEDEHNMSDF